MNKSATLSPCGNYRWTLTRQWDERPKLLVCMFNPSTADTEKDDPTVSLLCHIAAHNGYGGIVVVNGNPLRSSTPAPALAMFDWDKTRDWSTRDVLQENLSIVLREVAQAGAVLLAWGGLAWLSNASADWFDNVREEIESALPEGSELYCLGRTKDGLPIHPKARGKYMVPKNALLLPWNATPPATLPMGGDHA